MAEPPKKNAPKTFDIHRTLPTQRQRVPVHRPVTASRHAEVPPESVNPPKKASDKPKRSIKKKVALLLLILVAIVLALAIFIGVWDERNISAASKTMFGSSNLVALTRGGSLKTDADGRVNVLIVGYSADDAGHQGAQLTDSILLLSMNPAKHTGYMLSIPRDLYVDLGSNNCLSGAQYCKINEAYEDGGMSLLEQTVDTDLDVSINYYAIIDYTAVRDIVNALGGITVTINSPDGRLYDPNRDYTTHTPLVDLANGSHRLNGEQALDLTRARGDTDALPYGSPLPIGFAQSDYQRVADQRLVFQAIKAKLNWKLMLDPRQNSQILNALAANIKTDLKIGEARPLFGLFNSIPTAQLQSLSLNKLNGQTLLESYDSYYAGDTQSPTAGVGDYSQIQQAIQSLNK